MARLARGRRRVRRRVGDAGARNRRRSTRSAGDRRAGPAGSSTRRATRRTRPGGLRAGVRRVDEDGPAGDRRRPRGAGLVGRRRPHRVRSRRRSSSSSVRSGGGREVLHRRVGGDDRPPPGPDDAARPAAGAGRGATVLCVHDVAGNGHVFAGVLDALADGHRPIAFDLPGPRPLGRARQPRRDRRHGRPHQGRWPTRSALTSPGAARRRHGRRGRPRGRRDVARLAGGRRRVRRGVGDAGARPGRRSSRSARSPPAGPAASSTPPATPPTRPRGLRAGVRRVDEDRPPGHRRRPRGARRRGTAPIAARRDHGAGRRRRRRARGRPRPGRPPRRWPPRSATGGSSSWPAPAAAAWSSSPQALAALVAGVAAGGAGMTLSGAVAVAGVYEHPTRWAPGQDRVPDHGRERQGRPRRRRADDRRRRRACSPPA